MKLEERLTALRQEKGLSQAEVAEQLDVPRQAISRWETGKAVPTVDNLACLSRLYGVPMEAQLYGGEGAEPVRQETKVEAPEPEETAQGTPERPAGTAPGKQKGSGTSRRKAAALVLAAVCILLACIVAYVVEEQRKAQADAVGIADIAAGSIDVSGAIEFEFENGW